MRALVAAMVVLLLAAPAGAEAQSGHKTVGVLLFSTPEGDANLAAFRRGLAELGYVEGRNLALVYRYADGKPERLPVLAAELAALAPDLIFAMGGDVAPFARTATSTIPIVVAVSNDPVQAGLVASLARPGGNVTGVTLVASDLAARRLQLLKEAAPALARVAVLWNPDHVDPEYRETQGAGRVLGVQVQSLEVRGAADFDAAFAAAAAGGAQALVVVSSRLMNFNRKRILAFAQGQRIPVVSGWGPWAEEGALMSYGPDLDVIVRRAATHADRILKGASPAQVPIELPTTHELVLNLRTARTLEMSVPASLRAQATRVID